MTTTATSMTEWTTDEMADTVVTGRFPATQALRSR